MTLSSVQDLLPLQLVALSSTPLQWLCSIQGPHFLSVVSFLAYINPSLRLPNRSLSNIPQRSRGVHLTTDPSTKQTRKLQANHNQVTSKRAADLHDGRAQVQEKHSSLRQSFQG